MRTGSNGPVPTTHGPDLMNTTGREVEMRITLRGLTTITAALMLAGCGEQGGTFDPALADAFTEVVLAEAMHPADSIAWRETVLPRLEGTGYDTPEEVTAAVEELAATDSRGFTAMMDTIQMRLDRIRAGTEE